MSFQNAPLCKPFSNKNTVWKNREMIAQVCRRRPLCFNLSTETIETSVQVTQKDDQ